MNIKNLNQHTQNQTINEVMKRRDISYTNINGMRYWNLNEEDENNQVNKTNKKMFFGVIFGTSIVAVLILSLILYLIGLVYN